MVEIQICETKTDVVLTKYYGDIDSCEVTCCDGVYSGSDYVHTEFLSPMSFIQKGLRYFNSKVKQDYSYDPEFNCDECEVPDFFEPLILARFNDVCRVTDLNGQENSGNLWTVEFDDFSFEYCIQTNGTPLSLLMDFSGSGVLMTFTNFIASAPEEYFVIPYVCDCDA